MKKGRGESKLRNQIFANLRQRIESGEWSYGALLPSEFEFCRMYGISRGTLRQALGELEKLGYIRREQGRGTFVAFIHLKKPLSVTDSHSISFVVPYVRDSYVSSILLGLEREARACGYSVMFNHVENDLEQQEAALRVAMQQRMAGIILYPVNSKEINPSIYNLIQEKFPLVLVDRYIRGLTVDYVTSDNFGGGIVATQHLLGLGHRRIVFLSWSELASTMEHRRAGYRQALLEAGISPDPDLEWEVVGYPEIDQAELERRLQMPARPTAIFAANDQLALAVQRAARALKIIIPEELALVGFDDLDISAHLDIPLTSVAQPAFEIGRAAWFLLYARMNKGDTQVQRRILPVQLVVRRSCGAVKS